MLRLPKDKRHLFKSPFGKLFPEIADVLPLIRGHPIYTVGDVVTHRLIQKGIVPDIAIIDGYSMRVPCQPGPEGFDHCIRVRNPPATITDELIGELDRAVAHPPVLIYVEGEEDLAVIPLVIAAPDGAVILYGQPHQGVVLRTVDTAAKNEARRLLSVFIRES
jgi:GTP-dependent dephospho-CoA kinase